MHRRAAALMIVLAARAAIACAPAPHEFDHVDVVEETAIIAWDPATKTENFIRRATFQGDARDFGFLVPTPSAPMLAEFDDNVFAKLVEKTTRSSVTTVTKRIDWTPLFAYFFLRGRGEGAPITTARPPVEVLSTQKLAGYEATVLDATDAVALKKWLDENGYATTPDLTAWLDAYIQKQWKITAFKVDRPAQTSAVRMTFTTDRPFFPYREPASQRDNKPASNRSLRIFFLGPERVEGTIGADGKWPADLIWSERLKFDIGLPMPANTRLTRFDDFSSPRPGTDDLFFAAAQDQREVVPEPWVIETYDTTHVPLDLVIAPLLVIGFFGVRRMRSVRRR